MSASKFEIEVGEEMVAGFAKKGLAQVRPSTTRDRGEGPFGRLVLRGATVIDGTGAPPFGPADIVIEDGRIAELAVVGVPHKPVNPDRRPARGDREIDCHGKYVSPGFIDSHAHIGTPFHAENGEMLPADYIYKLWLAHGVTSVRETGCMNGLAWTCEQKAATEANRIAAPHLYPYVYFPAVNDYLKTIYRPDDGREWLRQARDKGAEGVKFFGAPPAIMQAALDECAKLGLRTCCHHAQLTVMRARRAEWHDSYTDSTTWKYFQPQRGGHGAYFYRWSVKNEVEWRETYRIFMHFLNDYKNLGGRVCPGSDSGFMYQIYGLAMCASSNCFRKRAFCRWKSCARELRTRRICSASVKRRACSKSGVARMCSCIARIRWRTSSFSTARARRA